MKLRTLAKRIEASSRMAALPDDGRWHEDRPIIWQRCQKLQEEGKSFPEAIAQARVEFIEVLLKSFLEEMNGDLRNSHPTEEVTERQEAVEKTEDRLASLV